MKELIADNMAALIVAVVALTTTGLNNWNSTRTERLKLQASAVAAHNSELRPHRIAAVKDVMTTLVTANTMAKRFASPFSRPGENDQETWEATEAFRQSVEQNHYWLEPELAAQVRGLSVEISNAVYEVQMAQIPEANQIGLWGEAFKKLEGPIRDSMRGLEAEVRGLLSERRLQ